MVYQYVAYSESGQLVRGKLSAATEQAAAEVLGYAGYRVVNLKQYIPLFNLDRLSASFATVKSVEVILFYRQLAMLMETGIDITASLELLQGQASNRALKKVLAQVLQDVRGGSQLSAALAKHPQIFSLVYSRLLGVGEQSGELEAVLRQVADYMEKEATTAKETKSALMYPIITFVMTIGVLGLLVTFVLPSFGKLYSSFGAEMPTMTKMLIGLGEVARSSTGLYFFLGLVVVVVALLFYIKTPGGRYRWDKVLLSLPLLGRVRHLSELARCCRTMALLFRAGLPLTEVLPLMVQSSGNRVMTMALIDVQQGMVKGEGLSRPMAKNKLFLPMMVQMVSVGEETGNLDATLQAVAKSYEVEAEDKMRSLIGLIQPVMTLFMGLVIGLIALSLMSTMFSMMESF